MEYLFINLLLTRSSISHFSIDSITNRDLHKDHRHLSHKLLVYTIDDYVMNEDLICLLFQQHSLHLVDPKRKHTMTKKKKKISSLSNLFISEDK